MKYNVKLTLSAVLAALGFLSLMALCGCATNSTKQEDLRYDPTTGKIVGKIATITKTKTFLDAKSKLANTKITQTEKTQGVSVGELTQESNGTNAAATVSALAELLKAIK